MSSFFIFYGKVYTYLIGPVYRLPPSQWSHQYLTTRPLPGKHNSDLLHFLEFDVPRTPTREVHVLCRSRFRGPRPDSSHVHSFSYFSSHQPPSIRSRPTVSVSTKEGTWNR